MIASKRARRTAGITSVMSIAAASLAMAAGPVGIPNDDGWTFDADPQGWTDGDGSCQILGNLPDPTEFLCGTTNEYDAGGHLATRFATLANAFGAFDGQGTWVGPDFTVPAEGISGVALEYSRALQVDQLIAEKGSTARTDVFLVDAAGERTLLERETLTVADADFARRTRDLGASALEPGGTYHLEISTFLTTEDAQLIAGEVAALYDDVKLTVTPTVVGLTGPAGADGEDGAAGPTGPAGGDGADGAKGADGARGPAGPAGADGAQGPAGPAGAPGQKGGEASVNSVVARRLLTIDRLQPFLKKGPFANQLRTRVFCRRGAEKRCEGVVKIRTLHKVNTAFKPGRKVMKRLTLGTGAYRLNIGQIGYAKVFTTSLGRKIIAKRGPLEVEVLFTALDEDGGQQTLRKTFTLRSAKK
jgi:hypothetical protein